jgi:hypothetical protein
MQVAEATSAGAVITPGSGFPALAACAFVGFVRNWLSVAVGFVMGLSDNTCQSVMDSTRAALPKCQPRASVNRYSKGKGQCVIAARILMMMPSTIFSHIDAAAGPGPSTEVTGSLSTAPCTASHLHTTKHAN